VRLCHFLDSRQIFVSWSPPTRADAAASPIDNVTMVCVIAMAPATDEGSTQLDFQKIRGDTVQFHEFYMRISQQISAK
jgi:hypothetical protein